MKKISAILLVSVLLFSFSCALAQETPMSQMDSYSFPFSVTIVVPKGYTMEEHRVNNILHTDVIPDDKTLCGYELSISFSEEHDGQSIADLTDAEKDALVALMSMEYENATVATSTTKEGTMIYVLDENDGESDFALAFTIYKGYFIHLNITKPDFSLLSDADIAMAIELLGNMQFTDK